MSCVYIVEYLRAHFTARFEVQSGSPSPFLLFWVMPDVTCAESLSKRTFHSSEVRIMVRPRAKRFVWNTRREGHLRNLSLTLQSKVWLHYAFIKTVCVRKTTCDVSFGVSPHGFHLKLIFTTHILSLSNSTLIQACSFSRN